jgi:hypothetical protein
MKPNALGLGFGHSANLAVSGRIHTLAGTARSCCNINECIRKCRRLGTPGRKPLSRQSPVATRQKSRQRENVLPCMDEAAFIGGSDDHGSRNAAR